MHQGFYNIAADIPGRCCQYYEPRKAAAEAKHFGTHLVHHFVSVAMIISFLEQHKPRVFHQISGKRKPSVGFYSQASRMLQTDKCKSNLSFRLFG